jgi:hypothetical protein
VYATTAGRKLMHFHKGETPPLEKEFWHVKHNPLVITTSSSSDMP